MSRKVKKMLTLTVTYDRNGVSDQALNERLIHIASTAVNGGSLTAGTEASVIQWDSEVIELPLMEDEYR